MELSDNERKFIEEYYVLGKSYKEIAKKIKLKADAKSIDEVRKLYQSTKKHDLVEAIKRLKSQYSGIKTRVKKANEKKDSKQFSNLSYWDEFKDFYNWYEKQKKVCGYCECTIEQVSKYLSSQSKLGGHKRDNRGESFEIDRLNHNSNYMDDEVILSCYICNNAKSDVIEAKGFMPVGEAIGKVIRASK